MSQNIVPAQYQPTRQRFDGYATESAKITRLAGRFRAVRNANAGYGVATAGELAEFELPCRTARNVKDIKRSLVASQTRCVDWRARSADGSGLLK